LFDDQGSGKTLHADAGFRDIQMTTGNVAPVCLVGAGPGDPELLTLKAHRLISEAEVVVYDRLVAQAILDIVPKGTSRIYVGKAPKCHRMVQDEINALLVKLARAGRRVVRLKGGDPFIFGRGSEESAFLRRHGVPVDVVPGVTAAAGCAAAAGIPLTHRGLATGVRFVTGHRGNDCSLELNWQSLADPDTTVVVYMGLSTLGQLTRELVAAGLPSDTPAAAISNGTLPDQRVIVGTLENLIERIAEVRLRPPTLAIIGRVVSLVDGQNLADLPEIAGARAHG
jgi:uroporphyrin-III C-methyltransferase